jgi:TRAP transporter 4TM/12TM fusion protein
LSKSELPKTSHILKRLDLLLPLVAIIGLLLSGKTATTAALWGIATAFIVSTFRKSTRMSFRQIIDALESGARTALPVIAAVGTAGIVVGIVTITGLGGKLAGGIVDLAQGQFFLILFFTMIASLVLGMGLPTTANYVVTASMAAPAILQAFPEVPIIAVHMFVFYFGIVADITPPVCLAAYAGAGIAGANPMKSGVTAFKLAIAAFIIPYAFVTNPVLLLQNDASFSNVTPAVVTALLGMLAISAAMIGFLSKKTNGLERLILFGAGILLVYPDLLYSAIGLVGLLLIYGYQRYFKKEAKVQKA